MSGGVRVEAFGEEHLGGFRALFEAASSGCFCRFWHFEGNKNEWLDRCAHRPDESFVEQRDAMRTGDPSGTGLVAIDEASGRIVGWMKLTKRAALVKLTRQGTYRSIPPPSDAPSTWAIGCFLVHPEHRKRGVARALVAGADAFVRARGGSAIEAFPRRSTVPLYDEEAWQGPASLFESLGYSEVTASAAEPDRPYPLMRKPLAVEKP